MRSIGRLTEEDSIDGKIIIKKLEEFAEYLDKTIDLELGKMALSNEDAIRKGSYCVALERTRIFLFNIIEGS